MPAVVEENNAAGDEQRQVDPRIQWFEESVLKQLRIKPEKYKKLLAVTESCDTLTSFLDSDKLMSVVFYLNSREDLAVAARLPVGIKRKAMYLLKRAKGVTLTQKSLDQDLLMGDVGGLSLEHLNTVTEEVFSCLLTNDKNSEKWPGVVHDDVLKHFYRMNGSVYVVAGQSKGRTVLPLPHSSVVKDGGDTSALLAVEAMVVDWSRMVNTVLAISSDIPKKHGMFPGPGIELDFWATKNTNLRMIEEQLQDAKVARITAILEKGNSAYLPTFLALKEDVKKAAVEAAQIDKFLATMRPNVDDLTSPSDYGELPKSFPGLLMKTSLMWNHCQYYTADRVMLLIEEISNDIIEHGKNHLNPEEIFRSEPDEAMEKIRQVIATHESFYSVLNKVCDRSAKPMDFDVDKALHRLNTFMQRVRKIRDIFETMNDFSRLEKIDVGGIKGKTLSAQLVKFTADYAAAISIFRQIKYDIMGPNSLFEEDLLRYQLQTNDLDRRLSTLVCHAFDDCPSMTSCFRLFESFGALLQRPIVQSLIEPKYYDLLRQFQREIEDVSRIFATEKECPPMHPNMAPITGALIWTHELKDRLVKTGEKLNAINHNFMSSEQARVVISKMYDFISQLADYDSVLYKQWTDNMIDDSESNLHTPILRRDEEQFLHVNFDPKVVALLREVKYFETLEIKVPEKAHSIFAKSDVLRRYVLSLEHIVKQYNAFKTSIISVESPLVEARLKDIDKRSQEGVKSIDWTNSRLESYIKETSVVVAELTSILQTARNNVSRINDAMKVWYATPIMDRKDSKKLLNMDEKPTKLKIIYDLVDKDGQMMHTLMSESCKLFGAEQKSESWIAYLRYVDALVEDGFAKTIVTSLTYLIENMDAQYLTSNDYASLLETRLELVNDRLQFSPSFDDDDDKGLPQVFMDLIDDIYRISTMVPRIAVDSPQGYLGQLSSDPALDALRTGILTTLNNAISQCKTYSESLEQYSYLWTEDRQEYMKKFLAEESADQTALGVGGRAPIPLEKFESEIKKFESIHRAVMSLDSEVAFSGWLRVDLKPLKQGLNVVIKKWSYSFTKYLSDESVDILNEFNSFIKDSKTGLSGELVEGDYNGLVKAMGLLLAVKNRGSSAEAIFESIRKTMSLLKQFSVELPEESVKLINDLPEEWGTVSKTAAATKDRVAPLQAIEVDSLQKRANKFEMRNHVFREEFKKKAPFRHDVGPVQAYTAIDICNDGVKEMESELADIRQAAVMFDLSLPAYKQLNDCRREVGMLKSMWDLAGYVKYLFDSWKTTLWTAIDIEAMDLKCRDLSKELRKLDKEVKAWDVYTGLDQMVKDMVTSLRAVGELRNSAIRDRHWKQLMKTTGVSFVITDDMKFQDLLRLQLHRFEDDVKGIVDRATKELSMEKVLVELDKTWNSMEFVFEKNAAGQLLIKATEELIETLEDNQVMLQNLATSKYIAHFLEQISKWQSKLSSVDSVTTIWLEVQQTWSHLENIFKGSEDIRVSLPEDTKRFDGIDVDYCQLVLESSTTPVCIQLCVREGLYEKLERLQGLLALCEKSLAEYLETKRLAFPRFYFVSGSDLLDILAKGNQPQQVMMHLPKLFDSLTSLKFLPTEAGKEPSKTAVGMYSREDEYVEFNAPLECTGAVEVWLNKLIDVMRSTLRESLSDAVMTYEEKPREQWIFDYCAQIVLAGTQIWWTTEVNSAFGRLEEGYDNSLKDYYKKQCQQLTNLITLVQGELTRGNRQMIMTVCTLDVHARDMVAKLISEKAENAQCFSWQSQLRLRWDDDKKDCFINVCDAHFRYSYEYLGNTPRLVVTPLTDRCYITLTQALHLIMGGAPAGPAGTGKTETTKDLGRALAIMVYVFNCSEQMDYKSVGNIFKGLAQSGTWGCFDEFNRISVEVLSVIATQVKSIQDALRSKKKRFIFQGEEIGLINTIGYFITMNPGYAGRAELPDNLKALFRPCSMCVPDLQLICEIMLIAEGFVEAANLAKKFTTLYKLCRELLSKQDHYDWALRAIKSVLVVAGTLKRADPKVPEEYVLMRALRDFNLPKIVLEDVSVFMGLIGDLFPKIEVIRKRNEEFESAIRKATTEAGLQAEEIFVLKCVQLEELLNVRHCVFVLGNAATGKSQVWKTLARAYVNTGRKCVVADLNPKAVTNDELFGYITPSREWRDGLFSSVMRDMASIPNTDPKWIILDDNIDALWVESLNTVMDDNKILTLASNERIPLKPHMRLIFEIGDLKHATPATVSRAGILFINSSDLGWNPFVQSWLEKREDLSERSALSVLFERYVNTCLDALNSGRFKRAKVENFSMVQTLCSILEGLLTVKNTPKGCDKDWFETYFIFAAMWAFGGSLYIDPTVDYRVEFSKWWINEFKTTKIPTTGCIFDYFVDNESKRFLPWQDRVPKYQHDPEIPLQNVLVPTVETVRIRYFLDVLADNGKPVLLVGNAGCGKTVLVQDKLNSYGDDKIIVNLPFNFYTTAWSLQPVMEKHLEKKAGRNYGPPGNKKLVYFIDDLNMPEVDKYTTATPHCLLRQIMDYKHCYDRQKLSLKDIHNVQFVACMNPSSGSFHINPRLQRHFSTFTVNFPGQESLQQIYTSILQGHLPSFSAGIQKLTDRIVTGALALHKRVSSSFLPSAVKFHYVFNLRDLSNIFQGLLFSQAASFTTNTEFVRLWIHETYRVYGDKLIDSTDHVQLVSMVQETVKRTFDDMDQNVLNAEPLLFSHCAVAVGDGRYSGVKDFAKLRKSLEDALEQHNEVNAAMNLVLFKDAISHVIRINRILESPRGNALLVGVGGSGKQSLSRLAAYLSNYEVFQITLRKGYGIADLKLDLAALYIKTGQKKVATVFLLTDSQIADEKFLVLINDLLASGDIPGLFADEDYENIINAMRPQAKAIGIMDTRENLWALFIRNVRRHLKVVLCFSPVGSTLRNRSRKFPSLVNCTSIDWFHEWPEEALISVANRFIDGFELVPSEIRAPVGNFMAFAHQTVNEVSRKYKESEKRHTYTTPKSFLEFISLYKSMFEKKASVLSKSTERLENGLAKLNSTAAQVDDLKARLATQEVELRVKNEDANRLIERVAIDTEMVNKEKAVANEEEQKVDIIAKRVGEQQRQCLQDLAAAEPALKAALSALDTLNKNNLTELKSFGTPADDIIKVAAACIILLSPSGKPAKDKSWKAAKLMMGNVGAFLDSLINFDKEHINKANLDALAPYLNDPQFTAEVVATKSAAAAGLCSWVVNIVGYYRVYCDIEPKRKALDAANAELNAAQTKLGEIQAKIASLNLNLSELNEKYETAVAAKLKCEQDAKSTQETIALANRLVGGLASEKVRWAEAVGKFKEQEKTLAGDVLLASAFLSYVGSFSKKYRTELWETKWLPYLTDGHKIPLSPSLDVLELLTSSTDAAKWGNEGLPNDRVSLENATMLVNCKRWSLIIDPQLQGITWIKNREGSALKVVRLGQKGYLDVIEKAISAGDAVLLEDVGTWIDPVLDPIIGRNLIKKGKFVKMGDKEVEYDPKFRLMLQTRLANPHYPPEIQAQTTLINFTVTLSGLEDQLLVDVVNSERPDLEKTKAELTKQQNEFKIKLTELEDDLLYRLSSAEGNFLGDYALVENLENTKRTASEIEQKVEEAKKTEKRINETRELYRPVAARSSLMYFLLNGLNQMHPMYQYSLNAYKVVFQKAIDTAVPSEDIKERVQNLIDNITYSVARYTTRGLFERDKLIFTSQMTFQIMQAQGELDSTEYDFLLRAPRVFNVTSPVDWINNNTWGTIKALSNLEQFKTLANDIEGSSKRWQKYCEVEAPENEKLPQEWKNKTAVQKLCILRALRPDRMVYAVRNFVSQKMGPRYVDSTRIPLTKSFEETGPATPVFFILSPGVDPVKEVERLGRQLGFTEENGKFSNVSLGQGQEVIAEAKLEAAYSGGGWVMLENIHLVSKWLPTLEKRLEILSTGSHPDFRVFLSAEPAGDPAYHVIPISILQASVKITNEPPTGMQANLHRALDNFNQESLERCSKESEFKAILFSLCYFHAVVLERRKFGTQGWNRSYPFSTGDLVISSDVLYNYLEAFAKVPWTDLRYIFGEIMYGGHISDDWDRRLCSGYLDVYIREELMDGSLELAPGFVSPASLDYKEYHKFIDETLPAESPTLYGLHPNAEIAVLTQNADRLFQTMLEMQPKDNAGGASISREEKVKQILDEMLEKLPEAFNVAELISRVEDRTPYINVALQECDRMTILINEIRRALKELNLGLKGDLTISESMENLMNSLYFNQVPASWEKYAYPSLNGLAPWYADLLLRIRELESWVSEFQMPSCVWLSGLFNPQSFLTAIMQTTARKNEWPLDRMTLTVDVLKKTREEITAPPREGAYVHGLFMEGARWDSASGAIAESAMKELTNPMPVVYIRAIQMDKKETKGVYECPVYRTRQRGPTYVWTFNLKTKDKPSKWVLAGAALLLSSD